MHNAPITHAALLTYLGSVRLPDYPDPGEAWRAYDFPQRPMVP